MVEQALLLRLHIDEEVGVGLVEVVDGDVGPGAGRFQQGRIGAGAVERRMGQHQEGAARGTRRGVGRSGW